MNFRSILLILIEISSLFACGPWFPEHLMYNREETLRNLPDMWFSDDLRISAKLFGYRREHAEEKYLAITAEESTWVKKSELPNLKTVRNAKSLQTIQSKGKSLPTDLRLYLTGAYFYNSAETISFARTHPIDWEIETRFNAQKIYQARLLFDSLYRIDSTKKSPLTVRAAYMKARCFSRLYMRDSAITWYEETTRLIRHGASNLNQLDVDSDGHEGRLWLELHNPVRALKCYEKQMIAISPNKYDYTYLSESMSYCFDMISKSDSLIQVVLRDSLSEFLFASYLYNRTGSVASLESGWNSYDDSTKAETYASFRRLGTIIRKAPLHTPQARDRFAAAAYRYGEYKTAAQLVEPSGSGLGWWIKAKLAVTTGDMNRASVCYSKAVKEFRLDSPVDSFCPGFSGYKLGHLSFHFAKSDYIRPAVESAVMSVVRGEFTTALSTLYASNAIGRYDSDYWIDLAYVAERLVTTDQLKRFIDSVTVPNPPKLLVNGDNNSDVQFRALLARRLMRENRFSEAIPYFNGVWHYNYDGTDSFTVVEKAKSYAKAASKSEKSSGGTRAENLFAQALILNTYGMELLGTELDPDWSVDNGNYDQGSWDYIIDSTKIDRIDTSNGYNDTIYHKFRISRYTFEPGFATDEEYRRVTATQVKPYYRFHYRYVGWKKAYSAAKLVPQGTPRFYEILDTGRSILPNREPARKYKDSLAYLYNVGQRK